MKNEREGIFFSEKVLVGETNLTLKPIFKISSFNEMEIIMDSDILLSGLELLLLGMGIVFIFLLILIFTMKVLYLVSRLLTEKPLKRDAFHEEKIKDKSTNNLDKNIIAVISAAVARYRSQN